jgi:hypothetical protein
MTDKERSEEGAGEEIEDLEAPASAQEDVAGGAICGAKSCGSPSIICVDTCPKNTYVRCSTQSKEIIVFGVQ